MYMSFTKFARNNFGMTKRTLAWISFVIGVFIIAFFRHYNGSVVPHPWLFYVSGLICFIVGFVFLRTTPTVNENKMLERANGVVNDLKQNGNKIIVDLDKCEIKENNYYEEPDYYKNATDFELMTAMDYVYLYNKYNTPNAGQVDQTVAVYKTDYRGKELTFYSPTMAKDRDNLLFKFSIKKTTTIYVDKSDPTKYYFDVEFVRE